MIRWMPLVYSFHEKFTQPFIMIKIPLLTLLRSTNDDIARHKSVWCIWSSMKKNRNHDWKSKETISF